jgi:hypothetical protein
MTDSEDSGGKTSSTIGELRRWSSHLLSVVGEEVRPFIVLLIVLSVALVFMVRAIPTESSKQFGPLIYIIGGAIGVVVLAGVGMAFFTSFPRRGKSPKDTATALTPEERGLLTMCIAAEKGSLKGTASRHISRPIKVRQKTLVSTFKKMLD